MHVVSMPPVGRAPLNDISVDRKNFAAADLSCGRASGVARECDRPSDHLGFAADCPRGRASTVRRVEQTHREHVEVLLRDAAAEQAKLIPRLPTALRESLPVDAQGLTRAIDYLAAEAGLSESERRALILPHALNPAVLHARIFGPAPLARETVIASFVEGARVRADALAALADAAGGEPLGQEVRGVLVASPPPIAAEGNGAVAELRATYAAHERAAVMIAASLDARPGG